MLFKTFIKEEDIFRFNQQGEIRSIFDDDGLKPDKYLSNFYPNKINAFKYRNKVEQEIEKLFDALQKKNIPVLSLETDYTDTDAEQLRTRIGAFVEMLSK